MVNVAGLVAREIEGMTGADYNLPLQPKVLLPHPPLPLPPLWFPPPPPPAPSQGLLILNRLWRFVHITCSYERVNRKSPCLLEY